MVNFTSWPQVLVYQQTCTESNIYFSPSDKDLGVSAILWSRKKFEYSQKKEKKKRIRPNRDSTPWLEARRPARYHLRYASDHRHRSMYVVWKYWEKRLDYFCHITNCALTINRWPSFSTSATNNLFINRSHYRWPCDSTHSRMCPL